MPALRTERRVMVMAFLRSIGVAILRNEDRYDHETTSDKPL
jgi:hypothetical protein